MGAISYLLRKNLKNEILDTLRHPLKLGVYVFVAVSMLYGAVAGFTAGGSGQGIADRVGDTAALQILSGGYLAILFFISIPVLLKGLSSGTSFFSLCDVNNMFVAPISERRLLLYGIGRQLATMVVLVITFSAYGGMLITMFRLTALQTFLLIFGIILMLTLVQLVTLMIFCLASCHPVRARVIRYIIYAEAFFAVIAVIAYIFSHRFGQDTICEAVSQPLLEFIPFIGWMHALVFGVINNDPQRILLSSIGLALLAGASLVIFFRTKLDFFEDVLSRAESYHEFKESIREGKVSDSMMMGGREIKLRKRGIKKGEGASAVFFKHLLESSRRSRFLFFNINTVVLLFVAFVIGFGVTQAIPGANRTIIYLSTAVICSYVQFFFSASGDWVKELTKPYIYLIPDGAVKKLIMASATGLIKPYTDGIITFGLLGIVFGGNIFDMISAAIAYGSFGTLYISANILAQRITGLESSGGVFITFYMSLIVAVMIPGIAAGIVVLSQLAGSLSFMATTLIAVPVLVWNIFISFIIFLACRNLLNNTE